MLAVQPEGIAGQTSKYRGGKPHLQPTCALLASRLCSGVCEKGQAVCSNSTCSVSHPPTPSWTDWQGLSSRGPDSGVRLDGGLTFASRSEVRMRGSLLPRLASMRQPRPSFTCRVIVAASRAEAKMRASRLNQH